MKKLLFILTLSSALIVSGCHNLRHGRHHYTEVGSKDSAVTAMAQMPSDSAVAAMTQPDHWYDKLPVDAAILALCCSIMVR